MTKYSALIIGGLGTIGAAIITFFQIPDYLNGEALKQMRSAHSFKETLAPFAGPIGLGLMLVVLIGAIRVLRGKKGQGRVLSGGASPDSDA